MESETVCPFCLGERTLPGPIAAVDLGSRLNEKMQRVSERHRITCFMCNGTGRVRKQQEPADADRT